MLEFAESGTPLTPAQLVTVTRENGRSINHYQDILEQHKLPAITAGPGELFLEIGTGLGNAIPGLLELTHNKGSVVSVDINRETLNVAYESLNQLYAAESNQTGWPNVGVTIGCECPHDLQHPSITLVEGDVSDDLELPRNLFDRAVSIWVFYQILDKFKALTVVLRSLQKQGRFYATCVGSVGVAEKRLTATDVSWLRERVWNTRASRFSWLTGTRELQYWADYAKLPLAVISLADLVALLFPPAYVIKGETPYGRPEGSFVITANEDTNARCDRMELDRPLFVTTRSSSVIPIYDNAELYGRIKGNLG